MRGLGRMAGLAVAWAVLTGAGPARAGDDGGCPPRPAGLSVAVESTIAPTSYRHDLDRGQLGRLFRRTSAAAAAAQTRDRAVLGLTVVATATTVTARLVTRRRPDGAYCSWLGELRGTLSITSQAVYVARDFTSDSCAYRAIRAHEARHVQVNTETVRAHLDELERSLRAVALSTGPLVSREPPGNVLPAALQQAIDAVQDRMEHQRLTRNAALDTPEIYRATEQLCDTWSGAGVDTAAAAQ